MKKTFLFSLFSLLFLIVMPFSLNAVGGHRGNITGLIHKGENVISAGEDGFIVTWNIKQETAVERFQLTTYRIQSMVSNPQKDELCIIETAGFDNYRISAWNYTQKKRLFSVHSTQPVTFINYSSGGRFIIAAGFNGNPLSLLDPSSGRVVSNIVIPTGNTVFGVTGRSERNILLYQSDNDEHTGQILYVNLDSISVAGSFQAPSDMSSPVIFDNNRFLAGVNSRGLQLVDAASGAVLDNMEEIERSALLYPLNDGFYCLNRRELYRFSVDGNGKLVTRQRIPVSFDVENPVTVFAYNESMIFASARGIFILGQQNRITPFSFNFQNRIMEIAAGENNIAALTENGDLFFLPLDYRTISGSQSFRFTNKTNYNRISPLSVSGEENFILWQTANTRLPPQLLSANQPDGRNLSFLSGRSPLRALSAFEDRLLILDTSGNLTVRAVDTLTSSSARPDFTFSSIGAIDAAFVNKENIILCRSVINNSSPFLSVNTGTSETVPRFYPSQAGLTVYSRSGNIYAAVIERDTSGLKTIFINLSPSVASENSKIFEYPGEATNLSIAESSGRLAIACDSEGAKIYGNQILNFERTNALPVKLQAGSNLFLSLDSDGNIAWHDINGKILAVFSLYENRWTLLRDRETITNEINKS